MITINKRRSFRKSSERPFGQARGQGHGGHHWWGLNPRFPASVVGKLKVGVDGLQSSEVVVHVCGYLWCLLNRVQWYIYITYNAICEYMLFKYAYIYIIYIYIHPQNVWQRVDEDCTMCVCSNNLDSVWSQHRFKKESRLFRDDCFI